MKLHFSLLILLGFIMIYSRTSAANNPYTINIITGNEIYSVIPFIVQERIREFRNYPYLYVGSLDDEIAYLHWFAQQKNSAVAIAYKNTIPVGFLTGTGFMEFDQHFTGSLTLFKDANLQPEYCYYFPEVIVIPGYSNNKISRMLFDALETVAQNLGYTIGCFVTELEDGSHPLKPIDYHSLDPLWYSLGYVQSSLSITFDWPTAQTDGIATKQNHHLIYWFKNFVR